MVKVLFAGTPDVAVPGLRALAGDAEHFEVVAVLTRPDAPTGRGRRLMPSPVKQAAMELGLPVIESDPGEETFIAELAATGAEAAAVVAYGRLLKQDVLDALPMGWYNPAFLVAAAVAWRRTGAARHLGGRRRDRRHGVPHHPRHGRRPDPGPIHGLDRRP